MTFSDHFTVKTLSEDLYCIQEDISDVNQIYTNDPLNLYLILGVKSALLLDTGCGLSPLRPIVEKLIDEKELLVLNSHAHWDHVLGNNEFEKVFIHEKESFKVSKPYNLSGSKEIFADSYADRDFLIPPAESIKTLQDGDKFDLGSIEVEVVYAPGHSLGSICLLKNNNELFTGDVAYYGDQFLPNRQRLPEVINTLSMLIELCEENQITTLYPSHQKTPCGIDLLYELRDGIKKIDKLWDTKTFLEEFLAWEITDPDNEKFRYLVSRF